MPDTIRTTPWPIGRSYIDRLPVELLENVFESFRAKPAANYLVRDGHPEEFDRYNYGTSPVDTVSYLQARRALHAQCLVSKKISEVTHRMLFDEIWITDFYTLVGLVKSLASYPHNRQRIKWLGIDEVFFDNCSEQNCNCGGNGCFERNRYHINWVTAAGTPEPMCWEAFNEALKDPEIHTFPDVRQILEMQQELEVRWTDGWHWMSDAAFERVCNLALKLIIFFSPRLRSLRLTATLGTATSPYIFRYALGLIPLPTTNLGAFSILHGNNCAEFLTVLNIDLSSLRVCYGPHHDLRDGRASRCLESIEDLTLVDDSEVSLGPEDEHECRGIEPDFLQVWLEPAKRLRKFRLYTSFDLEGLARWAHHLGHNINTILLCHRETLQHFEWCQMVNPRTTNETAWKKMFGEEQKLSCLPQLKELEYLKLSHVFVYTRQQYINRGILGVPVRPPQPPVMPLLLGIPAPIPTQTPPVPESIIDPSLVEINIRSVLTHNLSELGAPPKLTSVDVVGNLPTDRCITIEL
ncbi:hypothetical protein B0H65DRAFT_569657 [Neurospora tetraspora]|uniref:Uncharacterized protein n=1 Tax=Neurospora tetraspora TaxID=94610 RepID=A0AAE0JLV8_9PEZI|nr:hypothetical protein B0H65DRAFT_569657 [Neurospora tetraspora]